MNTGKTLFAQLMDFLPWSTFDRIVTRYGGNRAVRSLSCAAQYQAMAFAQLAYRESLRDIKASLSAQSTKLYHMGFRKPVRRSTLADANEARDWRIYAEFAQRLIAQARRLYAEDSLGMELNNTVYPLDSTTIDLCLSVFPWGHFRSTKAAVKMHTLLDLRGNIPSFIHISDGKLHDVHALDMLLPEPGAVYVMDRGCMDCSRLHTLHEAGAFFGAHALNHSDDYPDFVIPLARAVAEAEVERGVALCGSGVGASVAANKVSGVRAGLIHDVYSAYQGVEDDDMNVFCLGGQLIGPALALELVGAFLRAHFSGAERHRRRLAKVVALEGRKNGS